MSERDSWREISGKSRHVAQRALKGVYQFAGIGLWLLAEWMSGRWKKGMVWQPVHELIPRGWVRVPVRAYDAAGARLYVYLWRLSQRVCNLSIALNRKCRLGSLQQCFHRVISLTAVAHQTQACVGLSHALSY
jgi:hypothetical protein